MIRKRISRVIYETLVTYGPYQEPVGYTPQVMRNHTQHCKCPTCCDCGKPRDGQAANPYYAWARRLPR